MAVTAGKLTYLLQLESNLGAKASAELKLYERANQSAEGKTKDLSSTITRLGDGMARLAEKTASSSLRQAGYLESLGRSYDALRTKMQALNNVKQAVGNAAANAIDKAPQGLAAGAAMVAAMSVPVQAFQKVEKATTSLKMAMMDKNGNVSEDFQKTVAVTKTMGDNLPGTQADFLLAGAALKKQGIADKLLPAATKAAGEMAVVLEMMPEQAAEIVAKIVEAYNIKEEDLPKVGDMIQRHAFMAGMKASEVLTSTTYSAAATKRMGVKGLSGLEEMLTVQGMGAQNALEGSSFGTNYAMLMTRLSKGPLMLEEAKKGMKAKAKDTLDELGIKFNFFDEKGNAKSTRDIIQELEKLKVIEKKAGQEAAMQVAEGMFGAEASRPASILAEKGVKGFDEHLAGARDRANQDLMLKERTKTYDAKKDALSGTVEGLLATMGAPIVDGLKPAVDALNDAAGKASTFFGDNKKTAAATTVGGVAAIGVAAYGGIAMLKGLLTGGGKPGGGLLGSVGGGLMSGLKLPLPVYIVNKHMSLTKDAMSGIGAAAGTATTVAAGKAASAAAGTAAAGAGTLATGAAAGAAASGASKLAMLGKVLKVGGYIGAAYAASGVLSKVFANEQDDASPQDKAGARGEIAGQTTAALAGAVAGKVAGKAIGAVGGRLAGMAMGAAMGSVIPVVGTILGGAAGLVLGSILAEPMGEMGEGIGRRIQANAAGANAAMSEQAQYDPMTGMPIGGFGSPNLLREPAYAALQNPAAANAPQNQAALEALKQPTKVELQPSQMTIKIEAPEGYNATAQLASPNFKPDGGSTAPWARN